MCKANEALVHVDCQTAIPEELFDALLRAGAEARKRAQHQRRGSAQSLKLAGASLMPPPTTELLLSTDSPMRSASRDPQSCSEPLDRLSQLEQLLSSGRFGNEKCAGLSSLSTTYVLSATLESETSLGGGSEEFSSLEVKRIPVPRRLQLPITTRHTVRSGRWRFCSCWAPRGSATPRELAQFRAFYARRL